MEQPTTYTLKELLSGLKECIATNFQQPIWIVAEINSLTHHRTGHRYLSLIQKSKIANNIVAQVQATIWANRYNYLAAYFEQETDCKLEVGMNVMLQVTVVYHEVYGLSLNVLNINPTYTLGDMERAKREIIERLISEGVFDMNKSLPFPTIILNVAVISSSTAAGYGDFLKHINTNIYGYKINITLFDSIMQGANTEQSVLSALNEIGGEYEKYDAVVIVRGGGSKNDLSWFDNYNIAYMVTQFPIPVISGIGHERDESIVDMVASKKLKTPTAVAGFIIDYNAKFEERLDNTFSEIVSITKDILNEKEMYLNNVTMSILKIRSTLSKHLEKCTGILSEIRRRTDLKIKTESIKLAQIEEKIIKSPRIISNCEKQLSTINDSLQKAVKRQLETSSKKLELLNYRLTLNDPRTILKRGYSISRVNGKIVTSANTINEGDIIETVLHDGKIVSEVKKIRRKLAKPPK